MNKQQKFYLDNGGRYCPCCESEEIEGREVDIDAGTATQQVVCNQCHASWVDQYTLTGFEILEGK